MLYEAGYDKIELYSATKGMNQEISSKLISQDHSYYIENILPESLGEGKVRYGTQTFSTAPEDTIIEAFDFKNTDGSKQQVLYMNGYAPFNTVSNLAIVTPADNDPNKGSSNHIILTSPNYALFQPDTFLKMQYETSEGGSPVLFFEIVNVTPVVGHANTIDIEVGLNSFPAQLQNFFILAIDPSPVYISGTQFSITVPMDFISDLYYYINVDSPQQLILNINGADTTLTVADIDASVPGTITFTCSGTPVPSFTGLDTVTLKYQSLVPRIISISNSYGYIQVLDVSSNPPALLTGGNQTLSNLSVACLPRAEYFAQKLWICNGVDPIMTWDGSVLQVYTEQIKDNVVSFNRIDDNDFSASFNAGQFNADKHQVGMSIRLIVSDNTGKLISDLTTTITAVVLVDNIVTFTVSDILPAFTGANRVELFYFDKPPAFSFMKAAHDRLWCLGPGAVGLDYRISDEALKFYYSYTPYSLDADFRFFNEKTKVVPSDDISAKHGTADNLEAIVLVHGYLAFVGREKTQIWQGVDPLTETQSNSLTWSATLPVGIYHGNLIVELANDAYFVSQNGFLSVSTFNIARQFGATSTTNMDKLCVQYIKSINTNRAYRSCRSFKYDDGGFCGFKIGQNDVIVSRFHTSLYWWAVFSGDFAKATTFMSIANDSLYLYIGKQIFRYADGINGSISYGDNNGTDLISFIEVKYVNNIKNRFANKRYEIQCDYSSNVLINQGNDVKIYIRGDLRTSFTLSDDYMLQKRGDVLGTINLANGTNTNPENPDNPNDPKILDGFRLDAPFQTIKGRLKFVSSNFSVSLVGQTKDGPFSLKKIRLFGVAER